ncbi:hypothetical protein KAT80_00560 [Candidatus Pacearchaeota archaeon]|nr:hypothetical protein [Candidatus Pacearchaeota archaeon]
MEQKKRLGGWQCWVDLHNSYVIKTPKNRAEIKQEVEKFLTWKNKLEELDERTDKMIFDINNSTKIVKKSKIPKQLLANLEFIGHGKIKQKKVLVLEEALQNLKEVEKLKLIDKITKFLLELWKYGIHEKTFKFFSNLGIDKNKVILIDVFELTSNKKKVLKQIKKRQWAKTKRFKKHLPPKLIDHLIKKLDKTLTEKNLEKYWKTK